MTQRHFIALADKISSHNQHTNIASQGRFYEAHLAVLADFCASQNPRFDRQLWLDYIAGKVGPNGGKVK